MIEISFQEFMDYKWGEPIAIYGKNGEYSEFPDYELYVLKNEKIIYIGISRDIYERWFGWRGRMPDKKVAMDTVARTVIENMPSSLEWRIELWTLEDCLIFYHDVIPLVWPHNLIKEFDIKDFEKLMIVHRQPIENTTYKDYFINGYDITNHEFTTFPPTK